MVDIHSHILHGVDDGCKTIEDSLKLLYSAVKAGIKQIILTPHYSPSRGFMTDEDIIESRYNELKIAIQNQELDITIFLGREVDEIEDIDLALSSKKRMTLHDTNLILLDFGMSKTDIDEYCYDLVINGYTPIVAHSERYNYIKNLDEYKTFKKTGALIQVNSSSICKPKSRQIKRKIKYLFKNNLVDFIASDLHASKGSYDSLRKARKIVEAKYPNFKEKSVEYNHEAVA